LDTNRNDTIDFAGNDRITWTTNYVTTNTDTAVRRAETYVWNTAGTDVSNLVSTVETSVDGLRTWNILWNAGAGVTNQSQTAYAGDCNRYVTNTAPDGSYTLTAYSYGRLSSVTRYSSTSVQLGKTTYAYDAHGRVLTTTDARNGATTYAYNNADQVTIVTTPAPGTGQGPQTTRTYFDSMSRATNVVLADLTSITNEFSLAGELRKTFGSRTYPVGYGYDAQGRMKTMTNWSGFSTATGTRVTTWNYDSYRGFLTNKVYDGGSGGPSYRYTPAGRLQARAWARGITTTNSYNNNGELSSVSYSDTTPSVTTVYDRRGRATTVTNGTAVCTLAYTDANQLLIETNSAGTLAGLWVTNTYDSYLRRSQITGKNGSTTLNSAAFAYDYASRLTNVTDGTYSAGYSYLANSPLISQIAFRQSGSTKMTTTKQHDYLNRLLSISSSSSSLPISYAYGYNDANQRTRVTLNDGSFWVYQYDALGQVTSGKKYWSDGIPVPGQQFEYGFDDIGNRTSAKAGGDQNGAGLRPASYGANSLNQYTNRTIPSAFDVIGIANASSSVTVNSSAVDYRRGEYFQEPVSVNNSSTSVWQNVSVTTSGGATNAGNVFVPTTTETYSYDADGNLTNDGRWTFTWDGENRLVTMQALSSVPSGAKKKLDFTHDYQGRRIQKVLSTWNGSAYVAASTNKFLYDGWNLLAELNGTNGVVRTYLWGTDLSGGLQRAGGVGGLLAIKPTSANPTFVAYDGNGNVTGLIDATTGTISGQFEYGPFGETIRLTPNANNQSPFRFSTKYSDDESDFLYYGFRYYNPSTGRWLSRDPITERGGMNLYGFVRNHPVMSVDRDGRAEIPPGPWGPGGWVDIPDPTPNNLPYTHTWKLQEKAKWMHGKHFVRITCTRGTTEEIRRFAFEQFTTFASFNTPTANKATVRIEDGIAWFDLKGVKGWASDFINSDEVPVYLTTDPQNSEVTGTTAGDHQLIGIRKWRVQEAGEKSVFIMTEAWERAYGLGNEVGAFVGDARDDQIGIWKIYLENIGRAVTGKFGGKMGTLYVIGPTESGTAIANPFATSP
jgi:RHS repeat-associated protein